MADLTTGDAPLLIQHGIRHGLLRNEMAYVLATSQWETAHTHKPVKEAYWLSESWRAQNLRYYPWYGRGYVQLTWEENYKKAQERLDLGTVLTDNPDRALEPTIASDVIIIGMKEGWFTGKKLSDYITLQNSDFYNARKIVNGLDKAAEIANIAKEYDELLLIEGYGVEPEIPGVPDEIMDYIKGLAARIAELERWRKS